MSETSFPPGRRARIAPGLALLVGLLLPALLLPPALLPSAAAQEPGGPPAGAGGQERADRGRGGQGDKNDKEGKKLPAERSSKTRHTLTLDGRKIAYTATAGTFLLRDDQGDPKASLFYVSYVEDGTKDPGERPVTFCFNGGPGAASLWVHMGAFGPKIVARDPEGMGLPPPGRLVDNPDSLLDLTDLVFIDPVDTGYSRPAPGEDGKQFHGLRQDIEWVGEFIRLWVTRNRRWASPKFLAGESYGTTRAAGLASYLGERYGMALNGVVLMSFVLNFQNQDFHVGNDMPYIIHLPSYAAAAWYHKKLPPELAGDLEKTLAEVESFARNEYALALLQGDRLPPERRREIAAKVARYTGLSPEYVERSNLRIEIYRFTKELLRAEGKTLGRIDCRFTGSDLDAAGETPEFDPSIISLDSPYAAAVNDYIRRELGYEDDAVYERLSRRVFPWSFADYENQYANLAESLRQAMTRNPDLKVLVASGYFDFATPYFDAIYTVDHLGLPPALRGNVRISHYQAGHMMYVRASEHAKLKRDVAQLLREGMGGR